MLQQFLENLPSDIQDAKRFFPLHKLTAKEKQLPIEEQVRLQKKPDGNGWQKPENQNTLSSVQRFSPGRLYGFEIRGYAVFDFDNALDDDGNFVNELAERLYNLLTWTENCYVERSISGHGLHIITRPASPQNETLTIHFDDKPPKESAKLELYNRDTNPDSAKYFVLTGDLFRCDKDAPILAGLDADTAIEYVRREVNNGKPQKETPSTVSIIDAGFETARARAMLDCIDCSKLDYGEWLKVGMALKTIGVPFEAWDMWSATDSGRYKAKEMPGKWVSFDKAQVGMGTLHRLAKMGGYREKDFQREWYRQQEGTVLDSIVASQDALDAMRKPPETITDADILQIANEKCDEIWGDFLPTDCEYVCTAGSKSPDYDKIAGVGEETRQRVSEYVAGKQAALQAGMVRIQARDATPTTDAPKEENGYFVFEGAKIYQMTDFVGGGFFEKERREFANLPKVSTGLKNLDAGLGSVYPALYLLGAVPSGGKTSLCLQLADTMARQGVNVLFLSAEQTALELAAKSLSRITFKSFGELGGLSGMEIRTNKDEQQQEKITDAAIEYQQEIAPHCSYCDIIHARNLDSVEKIINSFVENTPAGMRAVFIDYLQVLEISERLPDMERVALISARLRSLQAKHGLALFVVSSFNRSNYLSVVDFESFKGSGNLEFDADIVFGLQYQIAGSVFIKPDTGKDSMSKGEKRLRADAEKHKQPRRMELVCLKNRYGNLFHAGFKYYSQFDTFAIDEEFEKELKSRNHFRPCTKEEIDFADSVIDEPS